MRSFNIVQISPANYRSQIVRLWEECLPGTPANRYEWMNSGNPAGPTIWFLAFQNGSRDIAGTSSIMPREVLLNGRTIRGGILGDIMVHRKYRRLGIGYNIQLNIKDKLRELGIDFLYVVPNSNSRSMLKKVGFKNVAALRTLVKPIKLDYFLRGLKNKVFKQFIVSAIELGVNTLYKGTYISSAGIFEELSGFDKTFEKMWHKIRSIQGVVIGDRSLEYLKWRYLKNPHYKVKALTYKESIGGELLGYSIFSVQKNKLWVLDIAALHERYADILLRGTTRIAKEQGSVGIYIDVAHNNPWLKTLKRHCFFDTFDRASILAIGNRQIGQYKWHFFAGDRNI